MTTCGINNNLRDSRIHDNMGEDNDARDATATDDMRGRDAGMYSMVSLLYFSTLKSFSLLPPQPLLRALTIHHHATSSSTTTTPSVRIMHG